MLYIRPEATRAVVDVVEKPFRSICPGALCTCGPTIYFPPPFVPLCQPVLIYLPLNIFARLYCANIPASIHASKAGFVSLQRQRAAGRVNLECFPDFNYSFLFSKIILSDFLGFLEAAKILLKCLMCRKVQVNIRGRLQ